MLTATRWSSLTELASKLVSPVSNIVLARLLAPEAFGVVATITMIITFVEVFTDAGFQKYLIQHEFESEEDRIRNTDVAFWSNLFLSAVLWGFIILFREPLAALVGNPGLGAVIAVACVSIVLEAFSSIQMALYKRDLDFKTLFKVRIVGIVVPIVVTIPLAFLFRSYWALIIGTIVRDLLNAALLTYYSKWKPSFYYSFAKLREMFSFTFWSMCEAVAIWMTSYVDVFIVGVCLNDHILGIYKTSMTTVGQIMGLVTAATTPIIFSSLSRLQASVSELKSMFLTCQKFLAMVVFPIGVIIFCYSSTVCEVLLGSQWTEAVGFIGLWGLMSAVTIIFSHYNSEVFRALGKPKVSLIVQVLHLVVLIPAVLVAVRYGYEVLYVARSLVRLELIFVSVVALKILIRTSFAELLLNVRYSLIASVLMVAVSLLLSRTLDSILLSILGIGISCMAYLVFLSIFPESRSQLCKIYKLVVNKK
ncbi:MAG: lipopolysaccharide biosynthesis protein [Alistipes sp.]|nr:lipopolysaccharide biosynthesis protein [Alistipes sp.]